MNTSESKYCNCLYFTTNALARKVEKMAIDAWKPAGLSPSHAYLLLMVIDEPGIQPGLLSNHLQLSPSTVSRLIAKLETKKLLVRVIEGKLTNVYATAAGRAMLPQLKACIANFNKSCSAVMSKEESIPFVNGLAALADRLG